MLGNVGFVVWRVELRVVLAWVTFQSVSAETRTLALFEL
jgi:hypothetical protein